MDDQNEHRKPPKELIKLLEEKLYIKPAGIKHRLDEVASDIQKSIEPGKKRFEKLLLEIDKEFPPNTALRGAADGLTYFLFDSVFELYYIENNSALFIELQGLLERFSLNKICDLLAVNQSAQNILHDSYFKKTLNDFAEYFESFGLWTNDEVKFAKKLTTIRNGIAHKNTEIVSKHLGDGKQRHLTSIHDITKKTDVIPFIIKTIKQIVSLTETTIPDFLKNPRFISRLEAYSSIIGLIFNLFCDREFIALPNEVKFTMINRMFGKTILLSSEKLRDLLNEFKVKIIEFHDALGEDEIKSINLHKEAAELGMEIFIEMRSTLQIDGDSSIFKEPKIIELDIEKLKKLRTK